MKRINRFFPFLLILLTCLISSRFLFFVSYIHLQKSEFRKQLIYGNTREIVQFNLAESDLYLDKNGFEWKEKNKELVVNGVYHEVISITKKNGRAYVSALSDTVENKLFQTYFELNKPLKDTGPDLIKQLLNLTFLTSSFKFEPKTTFHQLKLRINETTFATLSYSLKTIKPPEILFLSA